MKHHRLLAVSAFLMLAIPMAHAADKSPGEQIEDRFEQMQTLIDQARQAQTPEERQKLVVEHMKLMQEQMSSIDAMTPKVGAIIQSETVVPKGMMPPAGTIGQTGLVGQGRVMGQGRVIGQDGTPGQGKVMGMPKDSNTMDMKAPPPILTMPQRMNLMQRMMGQMLQEQQVMMMPAQ